ncbi:LysE family translocator [Aeoliella sp. SH292]|uniref:LysE family translocator n=1 Tax=Aeoliella sp. SH292 TaxID=3454464 RepID=UPI003F956667
MAGIDNYWAFILAAIVFSMTPGIDTFFVLNRSVAQGRRSGFFSTLGISTGVLVHTFIAAVGLSALIAQSALAFALIKYLGAAYLVFLGISKLVQRAGDAPSIETPSTGTTTAWNDFRSGVLTNVLNPKVGLFFIAFFPQFIRREMLESYTPFVVLGITYALIALVWLLALSWLAGTVSHRLRETPAFSRWMDRTAGAVFVALGAKVAAGTK